MEIYILIDTNLVSVVGVFFTELQAKERRAQYFHPNKVGKDEKRQVRIYKETVK